VRVPDETLSSESVCFPVRGERGACTVETPRCAVAFVWDRTTLPHLQLWQRLRAPSPVLSIEPCSSERVACGLSGEEPFLRPGAYRQYALSVLVTERSVR
jgi:hypothetical protein